MAAPLSFQGLSTNLPTDQLINSIITQESQPMVRMQTKQAANNLKTAALNTLKVDLISLSTSMSSLTDTGFQARTVSSSDPTNASVTATASGANPASYDVTVNSVATRARMVVPATGGLAPTDTVGTGTYTLTDLDGATASINIGNGNNTLLGLRDAINNAQDSKGKPLNINAAVLKTGADGSSQLVLSAKHTGSGAQGASTFSLSGPGSNGLGLAGTPLVSSPASNAQFTVNGVAMERASNAVTDAVDGVTFNLLGANPGKVTTLAVGLDKTAITNAMQDVVTKFNAFYKDYQSKSGSTTAPDGTTTNGPFYNDLSIHTIVNQVHKALMGAPALPASAPFNGAASIGLKTNRDGTISLNTSAFQAALDKDATGVANVFNNTGTSTSPLLTFQNATAATTSAPIAFNVGQPDAKGRVSATFTTAKPGAAPTTTTLSSTNGTFNGRPGSPIEGLSVKADPGASGTLTITAGLAQSVTDLARRLSSSNAGNLGSILQNISTENYHLGQQISTQQEKLDHRKKDLHRLYSNLETTVGQMQAAGQSISSM